MSSYQAVILAGGTGSRMYPLTSDVSESKHFLPIANRPLISYQIELLERASIKDVIIVVNSLSARRLETFLESYKGILDIKVVELKDYTNRPGTVDAVLAAKNLLKGDFMVISGDLILDPKNLRNMIDVHRTTRTTTMLVKKNAVNEYHDFIGLEDIKGKEDLKKLILYFSAADMNLSSSMQIPRSCLLNSPNITLYNKLLDAHFYIFNHNMLPTMETLIELDGEQGGMSIKSSLIPYILASDEDSACSVYIVDDSVYCARANTKKAYMDINREVAKGLTSYEPYEPRATNGSFVDPLATVAERTTIGPQCIVGANTVVGGSNSVKNSVIGKNCILGDKVKVINSIVMDNVRIEDGVRVDNSIICSGALLQRDSKISASTVYYGMEVLPQALVTKEILRDNGLVQ